MKQKSVHQFIYKIESKMLKRAKWELNMPLKMAIKTYPEIIVSLNNSQCLRFIDEINGVDDINNKVRSIQKKLELLRKSLKAGGTRFSLTIIMIPFIIYNFKKIISV